MEDLKRVAQQFAQAAQMAGPSSYIPEVTGYSRAGSMEGAISQGLQGSGSLAGQKAKEADEADEAARKAAMQRLADKLDPGKYRRERKDDGGFAFFDPDGKEIGIDAYAQITGQRLIDILKDSENPIDQEYISDYANMNELAQAMYNNDQATIDSFMRQNTHLSKNMKVQDLFGELIRKYPHLYGRGSYQQTLNNRGSGGYRFNSNAQTSGWAPDTGGAWQAS